MDSTAKSVLIGSKAARHWFSDFREPNDTDYIEAKEKIHNQWIDTRNLLGYNAILNAGYEIAPPNVLYTLKVAHSFWDVHWDKTIYDIRFYQSKGCLLDRPLFDLLYKDNEFIHGKKKAYLDKSNEEFFDDGVKRKYIHDDLHKAVAFYERPLYEECKTNPESAFVSEKLFNRLRIEFRVQMCLEEIYVTALERHIIPNKTYWYVAVRRAFKQLVTSMTRGWFPLFMILHIDSIFDSMEPSFLDKFKMALATGEIRCV